MTEGHRGDQRVNTRDVQAARVTGFRVGDMIVDVERRAVLRDGELIALGALTFDLLLALARRAPVAVSAASLMKEVWPQAVVGPDALSQRVKLLRAALGDSADQPRYIESLRSKGYRIIAPVVTLPEEADVPASSTPKAPPSERSRGRPFWSRIVLAGLACVLIGVATTALLSWDRSSPPPVASSSDVRPRLRVAVLPLANLGDDSDTAFAEGMHDEMIGALGQVASSSVEIVSRTTMLTFRNGPPQSVPEIGRILHATHVIEGSVRREQDRVRLTLQLIDARTDSPVWSQTYERTRDSALTLQSEIAQNVVRQVAGRLPMAVAQVPPPPKDSKAYDLYLQARLGAMALVVTDPAEKSLALEKMISDAIRIDPTFGLAYIERFNVRMLRFTFGQADPVILMEQMRSDVEVAARLIPGTAALMAAEGKLAALNHADDRALALFDTAEAAGLADPYLQVIRSGVMGRMGMIERAMPFLDRAVELDPRNSTILFHRAIVLTYLRRPKDAIRMYETIAEQDPERATLARNTATFVRTLFTNSDEGLPPDSLPYLLHTGRYKEALERVRAMPSRVPLWTGAGSLMLPRGVSAAPAKPLSEGRINLLLNDHAAAARNGRAVLAFVANERENRFNKWSLKNYTAAGLVLSGDKPGAISAAHEALQLVPRSVDAVLWTTAATQAAVTLAWAGADDEAVDLLEQLAEAVPGLAPAEITRAPELNVPLAANARFRALRTRLEAQMAATSL